MELTYYSHARRDQMKVALTFDDGPNPPRTDQVIEILTAKGARGSFFVIGKWIERWQRAFDRMVESGQVIGNHTYSHQAHVGDYDQAEVAIGSLTGRPSQFLRAPFFNYFGCLYSPVAMSKTLKIIDADVNPADWNKTDPRAIVDAVLNHPSLAGGSVIDLHDSSETEDDALRLSRPLAMIEALPDIIDGLHAKGFQLVGLDEMEFVDPVQWSSDDERGLFASPDIRTAIRKLK